MRCQFDYIGFNFESGSSRYIVSHCGLYLNQNKSTLERRSTREIPIIKSEKKIKLVSLGPIRVRQNSFPIPFFVFLWVDISLASNCSWRVISTRRRGWPPDVDTMLDALWSPLLQTTNKCLKEKRMVALLHIHVFKNK